MAQGPTVQTGWRTRGFVWFAGGLLIAILPGCGGVQWHNRVEPALQRAAGLKQLTLVQFRTMTDGTCIEADSLLFGNQDVLKVLKDYQCVRLDYYLSKTLADQLGVSVVPTYVILRPDGSVVDRRAGRIDADEFRAFLKWAVLRR